MSKLKQIVQGWTNLIFKNSEVEKIARERAKICSECPFNVLNVCSKCGCPLPAKTRSVKNTNKCPKGKW